MYNLEFRGGVESLKGGVGLIRCKDSKTPQTTPIS